jgi:hypothetical protein
VLLGLQTRCDLDDIVVQAATASEDNWISLVAPSTSTATETPRLEGAYEPERPLRIHAINTLAGAQARAGAVFGMKQAWLASRSLAVSELTSPLDVDVPMSPGDGPGRYFAVYVEQFRPDGSRLTTYNWGPYAQRVPMDVGPHMRKLLDRGTFDHASHSFWYLESSDGPAPDYFTVTLVVSAPGSPQSL